MAYFDLAWYLNAGNQSTTGYYAVPKRQASAAVVAGQVVRQFSTPAVGSERCFVCIVAGTTSGATDATWVLSRGARTNDNSVIWQECTGAAAVNGDAVNTPDWTTVKGKAVSIGQIIKRSNGASYQICSTAGTAGSGAEPGFSNTAGVTTADGSIIWTSLGAVGSFGGGGAPHARLAAAGNSNWFADGNTVYIGDNHAESQASAMTLAFSGALNVSVSKLLCHNHAGSYPPSALAIGAVVSTTGPNHLTYNGIGTVYVYGVTFKAGVGSAGLAFLILSPLSGSYFFCDNCSFWLGHTGASCIQIGALAVAHGWTILNNCTVHFASTLNFIAPVVGWFTWQNTGPILAPGSAVPDAFLLYGQNPGVGMSIVFEALDLSQLTGNLVRNAVLNVTNTLVVKDCKLDAASVAVQPASPGNIYQFVRCDVGATAYKSSRYSCDGTETTETSITRVGGAVDQTGQPQSRKIVTTANPQWLRPFLAEDLAIWNSTVGADVTLTLHGTIHDDAVPNNDDVWLEVEYLGSASSPIGTIIKTTKTDLYAASAPLPADTSIWNNAPAGPVLATFDGAVANVTLSGGDRIASHSNTTNNSGARSLVLKTARKWYFEVTIAATHGAGDCAGILASAGTFTNLVTNGSNCLAVYLGSGNIFAGNSYSGKTLGAIAAGDIIGIAVDLSARRGWIRKNGGNWNGDAAADPVTGVGGVPLQATDSFAPAVGFGGAGTAVNDGMAINAGQMAYTMANPSGYADWADAWSAFRLTATLSAPPPGLAGYVQVRVRAAKPSTTLLVDPLVVLS